MKMEIRNRSIVEGFNSFSGHQLNHQSSSAPASSTFSHNQISQQHLHRAGRKFKFPCNRAGRCSLAISIRNEVSTIKRFRVRFVLQFSARYRSSPHFCLLSFRLRRVSMAINKASTSPRCSPLPNKCFYECSALRLYLYFIIPQ